MVYLYSLKRNIIMQGGGLTVIKKFRLPVFQGINAIKYKIYPRFVCTFIFHCIFTSQT